MGWQSGIPSIFEIAGAPAAIFIYSPSPGAGNLIGSWASAAGTDQYGNAYPEGIYIAQGEITGPITVEIGMTGGSQISLLPGINAQFNVTSVISGIMQAAMQLSTTDTNETVPGNIGSVILGSGTSAKMATVVGSPIGVGSAAYIVLESENDGGTDSSLITMGTVTSPDSGETLVFTPLMTVGPNYMLIYSGSGGQAVVTKTSGSGSISIPASAVSPGYGEAWGAGASEAGTSGGAQTAEGGCGGGGYSAESTFPITPGGSVTYSVPASANSVGGSPADCTLSNGLGLTVTAHSGQAGTGSSHGSGGPTSGNTISFKGGDGGARSTHTPNAGGGGGGGAAGPGGAGGTGGQGAPTQGGGGGSGASGGGNGGAGGAPNTNANAGTAPGGGGGGGGSDADGAIGGAGKVRLTYSIGTPGILFSIAQASGTDQFGNAYSAYPEFTVPSGNQYNVSGGGKIATASVTVTGTTGNLISVTIPAGEIVGPCVYELVAFGNATWGSTQEVATFTASLNSGGIGTANGPAATAFAASAALRWVGCARFVIRTAGSSGTLVAMFDGIITMTANNILPGTAADNSVPIAAGPSTTTAINTTVANTFDIRVSTSGTETFTAIGGYLKRVA